MINRFKFDVWPIFRASKMGHSFQAKRILRITGQTGAQPSKEWTDLVRFEIIDVRLKVLFFLGNPNAKAEIVILSVNGNMDHASDEKLFIIDATQVSRYDHPTLTFIFRNIEIWIRKL